MSASASARASVCVPVALVIHAYIRVCSTSHSRTSRRDIIFKINQLLLFDNDFNFGNVLTCRLRIIFTMYTYYTYPSENLNTYKFQRKFS